MTVCKRERGVAYNGTLASFSSLFWFDIHFTSFPARVDSSKNCTPYLQQHTADVNSMWSSGEAAAKELDICHRKWCGPKTEPKTFFFFDPLEF